MNMEQVIGISCVILVTGITLMLFKNQRPLITAGTIIILNGPSAVGKTSIIKAFQMQQKEPWLSIGIDNFFVGPLPPKFYLEDGPEHHAVMHGVKSYDAQGNPVFTLHIGPEGFKVIKGMHRAIAAYAKEGNNVIVDYINYDPTWVGDLKKSLRGLNVIWVGVHGSLEVIEQREKERATSPQGHARSHHGTVDQGMTYDVTIDTDITKPIVSASIIAKALASQSTKK